MASTARPRRDGCPAGRPRRPVQLALRSLARTLGATRALLAAASQGTRRSPGSERIGAPGGPGRTRTRSRSLSFEVAGEDPADSAGSEARGGVVFRVGLRRGYGVRRPPEGPAPEEGHPRTGLRGLTPPKRRPTAFAAERAHEGPLLSPKGRGGGDERRTCLSSDPPGRAGLSRSVLSRGSLCRLAQQAARGPESEAAARGGWLGPHEERPGKPEFPSAVTGVAAARTHTVRDPNPSRGSPDTRRSGNRDSVRPVLPGYGRP